MAERKQCKKCQKNKARLNSELCLECSLAEIAAGKMTDKPTNPPSEQELRDLMVRERGGAGVVKQEKQVMDKASEGKAQPQAQPGEPCCPRCGRPKSQVKLWIKKRHKCQNCLSAEIKERKKAYLDGGKEKKTAPQEEPQGKTEAQANQPQNIIADLTRREEFTLALKNSPMLYALFMAASAKGDTKDAFLEKAVLALNEQIKRQQDELINQAMNAAPSPVQADMVDHPPHYNQGKIEVADFIEDQGLDFFGGNVVKYVVRAPHKGNALEDLKRPAGTWTG